MIRTINRESPSLRQQSHSFSRTPHMKYHHVTFLILAFFGIQLNAQTTANADSLTLPVEVSEEVMINGLFLNEIDSLWQESFKALNCLSTDTAFWNINDFQADEVPALDTALIFSRLELLHAESPIDLAPNDIILDYIKFYSSRRHKHLGQMLGSAGYYFPLFEEKLDQNNLPLELKYLSIVESALNPKARSRVGATGLWQFMFQTGKAYGLEVNSYVDERMDPLLATEAACKYFEKLYSMYGDWNLVLAAYNAGPGNVNKAIRRSGGKQTYWGIRPYLPRETRGYVPAFIAVNYLMNFPSDHNIYPTEPTCAWVETDTIVVSEAVRFDQLEAYLDVTSEELSRYNPTYRKGIIPAVGNNNVLRLPYNLSGDFIQFADSIYNYKKDEAPEVVVENEPTVYYVRSGDVLGSIAQRHGCSVSQLKAWNNIRGTTIRAGQKLYIYSSAKSTKKKTTSVKKQSNAQFETDQSGEYRYHTVKSGDTLWDIANLYDGVSVEQLQRLNKGLNAKSLKQGQKIRIQKINS